MKRCLACSTDFAAAGWECPECKWSPAPHRYPHFSLVDDEVRGFPRDAFDTLARLEDGNFWFRAREQLITWALGRYCDGARNLLEVGCGTGSVLAAIARADPSIQLVGSDLFSEALEIAGRRVPQAELFQADARAIPYTSQFDVVCAFDVLEHLQDDDAALAELHRASRRGGNLMLTVPMYPSLWSAADDYGHHRRRYTTRELHRKVGRAGFTIARSTGWVAALLPALAVSRLRHRRMTASYEPTRELRLPSPLNRALELVLAGERAAIRSGISLPFGASRLVVADKT